MANLKAFYFTKNNFFIESYDLVLSTAFFTIDSLQWYRSSGSSLVVGIKVYASYEAMVSLKEGFLLTRTIAFNEFNIPMIEETRSNLINYLINNDPTFLNAQIVEE